MPERRLSVDRLESLVPPRSRLVSLFSRRVSRRSLPFSGLFVRALFPRRPHIYSTSRVPPSQRAETQSVATDRIRSGSVVSALLDADENTINHPVEPRSRTAILPPVLTKVADKHPLSWIEFTEDAIIVSCKTGE